MGSNVFVVAMTSSDSQSLIIYKPWLKPHKVTLGPFQIWCDVFTINHDPEYWEDPWTFNPERFLDEQGQLVGVDHVNRRRFVSD